MISAQAWNEQVRKVRAARLCPGPGIEVEPTVNGTFVLSDPAFEWKHPWWMTGAYEEQKVITRRAKKKDFEWHFRVRPGFVNGIPAAIDMTQEDGTVIETDITASDAPFLVINTWRNPLQSAGVTASTKGDLIQLPGEGYPKFFEALGVRPAVLGTHAEAKQSFTATDNSWRKKELRVADVALVTGRISSSQQITLLSALVDSQDFEISSVFNNTYAANHKKQFRLITVPKWTPPREPTPEEKLQGSAVEPDTDQILLASIYMVSQDDPEGGEDAVPDGTWTPYVKYAQAGFWNLNHAAANPDLHLVQHSTLTLTTGLAGGIADAIFASMLAPVNDAYNQIVSYLNSISFAGMFWTI